MWGAGAAYQDGGRPEEVAEGIVEEVDEGGGIEVRVAHQLVGEEGLARAAAEEAAHLPVAHVHLVRDFLRARQDGQGTQCPVLGCWMWGHNRGWVPGGHLDPTLDGADVRALTAAAVQVPAAGAKL